MAWANIGSDKPHPRPADRAPSKVLVDAATTIYVPVTVIYWVAMRQRCTQAASQDHQLVFAKPGGRGGRGGGGYDTTIFRPCKLVIGTIAFHIMRDEQKGGPG